MISTNDILRTIVNFLNTPIKIVLLIFVILTIIFIGTLIAEKIERLYIRDKAERIIDNIKKKGAKDILAIIQNSSILTSHKRLLLEVARHTKMSKNMSECLASSLLENYDIEKESIIKKTDLIVKLGPTFGLLGTLTPLGPGIIALSTGDTATLSQSLLVAFDTTVVGLICGAVCMIISAIRRKWYSKDRIMLTLVMESILETIKE